MLCIPASFQYHASFSYRKIHPFPLSTAKIKLQARCNSRLYNSVNDVRLFSNSNTSTSVGHVSIAKAHKQKSEVCCCERDETLRNIQRWFLFVRTVFMGGSWWDLSHLKPETGSSSISSQPTTVLNSLTQMWALVADKKLILYVAFGALVVAAFSEISMPGIITTCIFSAQNGEELVFYHNLQSLFFLCLVSGVCSGLRSGCFAMADMILVKRVRETVFSSVLSQDIAFFDRETVGDLTSRINSDCQRLSRTIGHNIHLIMKNIFQGTGAFINLMTLSWPLALSSLVICSILSLIFLIYGRYQKKAAMLVQEFTASSNEVAQESFSLIRTIRAYGTEREELQRFMQWLDRLAFVCERESVAYGFWTMSFVTSYRLTQIVAVLLGGTSILIGRVSAEQLTKYVLYCEWLIYAAWRLQDNISSLIQSVGASERVFQLMHLSPSHEFLLKEGKKLRRLKGYIEFSDVCFHYSSRKMVSVLKNVSFCIQPNEVMAIVGLSGSGKSTLINLLLRFYEPVSGEIYIEGIPLREMDIRWLRERIGLVKQEPQLFRMDVKSNISYGCSRIATQDEIECAAKIACAHEFISALPHGYDTLVDDNVLSGGQKQRIAIARAVLRDPSILILDEATSALDAENESHIKEILQFFKKDTEKKRTVIIIAHRLSTIASADRILVLEDGQVAEIGCHRELLSRNGPYAKIFKLQNDATSFG